VYLLHEHRIAFHANPRTASRAIGEALVRIGAEKVVGHHWEGPVPPDFKRFCVIRPHWEVLASFAPAGSKNALDHQHFIRAWLHQQVYCDEPTVLVHPGPLGNELFYRRRGCDEVLRYGPSIDEDVALLLDEWNAPPVNLEKVGVTDRGARWRDFINEESWVMLEKAFAPEMLRLFGNDEDWPSFHSDHISNG
jgi:hypothetical protein